MKREEMKVFHGLVNYGTQAGLLAKGLRDEGINAFSVVFNDSYFQRLIDCNISRDITSKNGIIRRVKRLSFLLSIFWKYNVFHFYFGKTLLPYNLDAPLYRLLGKKVVMEYLGTDVDLWLGLNGVDWRGRPVNRVKLIKRIKSQSKWCDYQIVCNPELYQFVDNSIILPLAIDLKNYQYIPIEKNEVLTFMHCPTNRLAKKTKEIEDALNKLREEGYVFNYKCVENVTHAQLKKEYETADVVIDQLGSWYGTVSIEAMALGRPVVAGYYPHLCHYDERYEGMPIINADTHNVYNVLKDILNGKYDLEEISKKSRDFVMRTHDLKKVTKQLIEIYCEL